MAELGSKPQSLFDTKGQEFSIVLYALSLEKRQKLVHTEFALSSKDIINPLGGEGKRPTTRKRQ